MLATKLLEKRLHTFWSNWPVRSAAPIARHRPGRPPAADREELVAGRPHLCPPLGAWQPQPLHHSLAPMMPSFVSMATVGGGFGVINVGLGGSLDRTTLASWERCWRGPAAPSPRSHRLRFPTQVARSRLEVGGPSDNDEVPRRAGAFPRLRPVHRQQTELQRELLETLRVLFSHRPHGHTHKRPAERLRYRAGVADSAGHGIGNLRRITMTAALVVIVLNGVVKPKTVFRPAGLHLRHLALGRREP